MNVEGPRPEANGSRPEAETMDQTWRSPAELSAFAIYYVYIYVRGLNRGGLTPASDSAYARRGCRTIEPVSATVLPKGALVNSYGRVRLGRERMKIPYTLHPYTLSFKHYSAESTMELRVHPRSHEAEPGFFSPRTYTM